MIKAEHLSTWYPPAKYLFLPLYKWLRKYAGFSTKRTAFTTVMASSGLLHLLIIGGGSYVFGHEQWKLISLYFIAVYSMLVIWALFHK